MGLLNEVVTWFIQSVHDAGPNIFQVHDYVRALQEFDFLGNESVRFYDLALSCKK
jgi:hypothetical protein